MFVFVPAGLPAGAPLVVALHGCTESASVYSTQTEWGNLASRFQFAVVFPEQQSANNSSMCFNWFQPGDISRGQGEALSIKQMVDAMKSSQGSDPARIFVTGMSAGGFMTEVMMAAYPDVFAGGGDATGSPGSRSIIAAAAPAFNTVTRTATWAELSLGAAPKLAYVRQLSLSDANISASAGLSVIIDDGSEHVVDARSISGFASYSESAFTARTIDLSAFAGKTVALRLVVTASDPSSTVTRATAWIDQIQIQ